MRSADEWFELYGQSHQNPTNKAIHWLCIPAIVFSTLGLIACIPPGPLANIPPGPLRLEGSWALVVVALALIWYMRLSRPLGLGLFLLSLPMLWAVQLVNAQGSLWLVSVVVFVVAWVVQLVGHQIEGKRPSFVRDLQFLLIGPAWLVGHAYRKLGIPI